MGILLQPWSLLLFKIGMFFVFLMIGAKEDYKAVTPLTQGIIAGILLVIATFGVFGVFKTH
jgi:hypothetical protein